MSRARAHLIAAGALAALCATASADPPGKAHAPSPRAAPEVVQASPAALAPDFTRKDLGGRTLRLNDYRGKVVLLNFWATWCEPCLEEIQTFSRWQTAHAVDGLQVIGIAMDDDPAAVVDAVRKYRVPYPVVMGDEQLGNLYGGVLGLPLSYLIDASGRVVARYQGEPALAALEAQLQRVLPRWHQ